VFGEKLDALSIAGMVICAVGVVIVNRGARLTPIAGNAAASVVKSALEALDSVGAGNVAVTGGPGPGTPWVVAFQGDLAGIDVPAMTGSAVGLTGGTTPAIAITTGTQGGA